MKKLAFISAFLASFSFGAYASSVDSLPACPNVQLWHGVNAVSGNWQVNINRLFGSPRFYNVHCETVFFDRSEVPPVSLYQGVSFALGLGQQYGGEANPTYVLDASNFGAMGYTGRNCSLYITPKSATGPVVKIENFNGAKCEFVYTAEYPSGIAILK